MEYSDSTAVVSDVEDDLVLAFLLDDGAGLVLGVGVVGQLRRARRHRALEQRQLEVVEHGRVVLGQERYRDALLARATRPTDAMSVIYTHAREPAARSNDRPMAPTPKCVT